MFSRFFINRPIFAAVVSIVIVMAGLLTLTSLPVSQYPQIEPPTVTVSTTYPGANAKVVADTVAAPIEQEVNGVEGMIYMSSISANDGSYSLTITFETGTDLDIAAVLVQNRVSIAMAKLPEEVKRIGVTTKKKSTNFAMMINLVSKDGRYDDIYLSNYATLNIRDELSRISGAGDVTVLGAGDYSMRIWLDPEKMLARDLTTSDISAALQEQNVQVAAGTIGLPPAPKGQAFQYSVSAMGRLEQAEQFENIIVKTGQGGRLTRIKDIGRVELGSKTYNVVCKLNSQPTALIQVFQLPGANLLQLTSQMVAKMEELQKRFPESVEYVISYNASDVVEASISEIIETLIIAAILVILTVYIFLQDWRATLIPSVTIPVSLIGTFTVMSILGFSINTLTLFGLVLAIGIVVDDAIVVVENVSRNIDETGLPAKEATIKAMEEVTGPVIATTLVLLAVFVPTAFMGGMTGILYKQFALTISVATVFSSINALTLSPSLCAIVMRPSKERRNWFFNGFNRGMHASTGGYMKVVGLTVRRTALAALIFVGVSVAAFWGLAKTPTGFVPEEDQGYMICNVQLPDGASLQRTQAVMERVNKIIESTPGVRYCISGAGYSILDSTASSNVGFNVVVFEPWDKRTEANLKQDAILMNLRRNFALIQDAVAVAFLTPALPGLGMAGGFEMQVQDRGSLGLDTLQKSVYQMVQEGNAQPDLTGLYTSFRANVPQLFVDVNRTKVKTLDVPLDSVFNTLQAYLGSSYVNDFNKFGRTYQVNIQADSKFRSNPGDIDRLEVRNNNGKMVPLSTVVDVKPIFGPQIITRYNMYTSASVKGNAAAGYSSGQALNQMEDMAKKTLPSSMGYEWTGISYQQKVAAGTGGSVFVIAVVFVFLVLAAQYESWKLPAPVVLAVPLAVLGAVVALFLRGLDNNVYTQIGLILLVGLATKNAILIVEFAKEKYDHGLDVVESASEAARLRFRPILMTAFSFILGVIPLVVASGAGAGSRIALGTAVMGGMLAATCLGVVLVPSLFVIFQSMGSKKRKQVDETKLTQNSSEPHGSS
jgi:HAE1 family hydrophobic/amphiphilic exporter-1